MPCIYKFMQDLYQHENVYTSRTITHKNMSGRFVCQFEFRSYVPSKKYFSHIKTKVGLSTNLIHNTQTRLYAINSSGAAYLFLKAKMSRIMRKPAFCMRKQSCAAPLFSLHRFKFLYFLNLKFKASNNLLWLCSLVCVGPGRKPQTGFLSSYVMLFLCFLHPQTLLFVMSEIILNTNLENCRPSTRFSRNCNVGSFLWSIVLEYDALSS